MPIETETPRLRGVDPPLWDGRPLLGSYLLRRDRCVVELSVRPWFRARLTAFSGSLEIGYAAGENELTAELDTSSLWTNVPLLAGKLAGRAREFPVISFAGTEPGFAGDAPEITGRVECGGTSRELRLHGAPWRVERARIIVWVRGVLPPPRQRARGAGPVLDAILRRPLHVEVAAEFLR
ncbi:YceI family protein [Amycolatopsis nigrescens]|uniref:YceI family protein n=1 Tax=Amycolatopsis nigrescens TaxID=381445 RepID=UPI000363FC68|nr:YceI family protein [Amycolatopsis nigrescens]